MELLMVGKVGAVEEDATLPHPNISLSSLGSYHGQGKIMEKLMLAFCWHGIMHIEEGRIGGKKQKRRRFCLTHLDSRDPLQREVWIGFPIWKFSPFLCLAWKDRVEPLGFNPLVCPPFIFPPLVKYTVDRKPSCIFLGIFKVRFISAGCSLNLHAMPKDADVFCCIVGAGYFCDPGCTTD
ncbi:hypothetical protein K1719_000732 [Acacia pycnantha]|nr:hypothetical protein K1719_000732 [Acacia pycnantha]